MPPSGRRSASRMTPIRPGNGIYVKLPGHSITLSVDRSLPCTTVLGMRAQEGTFRGLMTQDRQFRVPLYQRHYRWRTCKELRGLITPGVPGLHEHPG
jgi:hypothetical protein